MNNKLKLKDLLLLAVFLFMSFLQLTAQENELLITNNINGNFSEYALKTSDSDAWETLDLSNEAFTSPVTFTITVNEENGCAIDLKAKSQSVEYIWENIDICDATEVVLFLDDDGKASFNVIYEDEGEEETEQEGFEE